MLDDQETGLWLVWHSSHQSKSSMILRKLSAAICWLACCAILIQTRTPAAQGAEPAAGSEFQAGFGKRDITPPAGLPMWGYGARHDKLSEGALDHLWAKAVVIHAGNAKLALVGLDMGRGPTTVMMEKIRRTIAEKAKIEHVLISGSHTHHGPVIELTDRVGFGKGKFDQAVAYSKQLPDLITEAILDADRAAVPCKLGIATRDVTLNRNRHTKHEPKPTDPMLAVLRFDDAAGKPIAVLVNFAAHAVMTDEKIMKYSADYPGFMQRRVEDLLKTNCLFMQGAAGDMSVNAGPHKGPQGFGDYLGDVVAELAKSAHSSVPAHPSIQGKVDDFVFRSRTDFSSPRVLMGYSRAFFPELTRNFVEEFRDGVPTELNTILLNGDTALVGASGEFFCNHSNRLKQRAYVPHTFFFGYCDGHSMYFPTIEAASEGGYGGDATVSPVEVGAGEQVINRALINIYSMLGKFKERDYAPAPAARQTASVGPQR
jgi:neutral ceramidase